MKRGKIKKIRELGKEKLVKRGRGKKKESRKRKDGEERKEKGASGITRR